MQHFLHWVASQLGVEDKCNAKQWLLRLLVPPQHQLRSHEASLWLAVFSLIASVFGLLFNAVEWLLTLVFHALGWFWKQLLNVLPTVNHAVLGKRLEGWPDTAALRKPALLWLLIVSSIFFFWLASTTPFSWSGQLVFLVFVWVAAMFVRRLPGNLPTLILIALSVLASCRYGWWRATHTIL